jgi:hypothetical protein
LTECNGDGKADMTVWRPGICTVYVRVSPAPRPMALLVVSGNPASWAHHDQADNEADLSWLRPMAPR